MKVSYNILIAEDDILIAETLRAYLVEFGHHIIEVVSSYDEFISSLNEETPDFCFLDIRMFGHDVGFDMAGYLSENSDIPFMFLTSFSDVTTIKKASSYNPAGYLSKPFKKADVISALEIAMAKIGLEQKDKIKIKDGIKTHLIHPEQILFCKADNIYVEIQTCSKKYVERISLDKFLKRLPDSFQKCHRSFVVNTSKITGIYSNQIIIDNYKIPLSRTFKKDF